MNSTDREQMAADLRRINNLTTEEAEALTMEELDRLINSKAAQKYGGFGGNPSFNRRLDGLRGMKRARRRAMQPPEEPVIIQPEEPDPPKPLVPVESLKEPVVEPEPYADWASEFGKLSKQFLALDVKARASIVRLHQTCREISEKKLAKVEGGATPEQQREGFVREAKRIWKNPESCFYPDIPFIKEKAPAIYWQHFMGQGCRADGTNPRALGTNPRATREIKGGITRDQERNLVRTMSGIEATAGARLVLIAIASFDFPHVKQGGLKEFHDRKGWCCPGQATLLGMLGVSRNTLKKHIRELAKLGWLKVQLPPANAGRGESTGYQVNWADIYQRAGI